MAVGPKRPAELALLRFGELLAENWKCWTQLSSWKTSGSRLGTDLKRFLETERGSTASESTSSIASASFGLATVRPT